MNAVSNAEPAYKLALSSANSNVVREWIIFNKILEFCDLFKCLNIQIRVIEIADTEIDM